VTAVSQKAILLRLLRDNGARGVSVHDLIYQRGITRAAAIVHELKKDNIEIETINDGDGKLARYVLKEAIKPPPALCSCGHRKAVHVAGFRCMEDTPEGYCVCGKYDAVA